MLNVMSAKTWIEKRDCKKGYQIKTIKKKFADIPEGSRMFIATPQIVNEYIKQIPYGKTVALSQLRNDLAIAYGADKTCPVTTGIFLRIVSEAAFEDLHAGISIEAIAPFWRIVNPMSKLAKKLACGVVFIETQRALEVDA